MLYKKEVIDKVVEWIQTDSTPAYNFLNENNYKEWIATIEAIFISDKSLEWLIRNKQMVMAAFVKAVEGEKMSLEFLIKQKAPHLAAVANAINRDKGAEAWLIRNKLEHYAQLAEVIRTKLEKMSDSDLSYLFKGPI
ncbi:MAG TPA: hypothetical protein VI112_11080 [Bacteroidia bacterium]|jgi:hypothetical protein